MSEIWNVFIADGTQSIEEIEACLLSLDEGTHDDECMSQLNRSLHTIKGNASMMGLSNLSGLVHKTEDLVECITHVGVDQEENPIDLLFAIFDVIQEYFEHLLDVHTDIAMEEIEPLQSAIDYWITTHGVRASSQSIQSQFSMNKGVEDLSVNLVSQSASSERTDSLESLGNTKNTSKMLPAEARIITDPTMRRQILLKQLQVLEQSFSDLCSLGDEEGPKVESYLAALQENIDLLSNDIEPSIWQMENFSFDVRKQFFQQVQQRIAEQKLQLKIFVQESPETAEIRAHFLQLFPMVNTLNQVIEQYEFDEVTNQDVCVEVQKIIDYASEANLPRIQMTAEKMLLTFITDLRQEILACEEDLLDALIDFERFFNEEITFFSRLVNVHHFRQLTVQLTLLQSCLQFGNLQDALPEMIDKTRSISRASNFCGDLELQDIFICFQDALQRNLYGEEVESEFIIEMLSKMVRTTLGFQQGELDIQAFEKEKRYCRARFEALSRGNIYDVSTFKFPGIPDELIQLMTHESYIRLKVALEGERSLFLINADLEMNPDVSTEFFGWLRDTVVNVVTSATIYEDKKTAFVFLVDSPLSLDEIRKELNSFDPSGQFFSVQECPKGPFIDEFQSSENSTSSISNVPKETTGEMNNSVVQWAFGNHEQSIPRERQAEGKGLFLDEMRQQNSDKTNDAQSTLENKKESNLESNSPNFSQKRHVEVLRVDVDKVDKIMDLAGEIGLAFGSVVHHPTIQGLKDIDFQTCVRRLNTLIVEMQDLSLGLRLIPVSSLFQRMRRVVRDAGLQTGKKVKLHLQGEDTELDKIMIEHLQSPLVHLLRNAVDHGIELAPERLRANKSEYGNLWLSAYHQGSEVVISIRDDGRGIQREPILTKAIEMGILDEEKRDTYTDEDVFECILASGFSLKERVNALSGRGVGLDVVRSEIQGLKGTVSIQSTLGTGTEFLISLPLTVAFLEGMLVQSDGMLYIIPIEVIREVIWVDKEDLVKENNQYVGTILIRNEEVIPLLSLREFYMRSEDSGMKSIGYSTFDQDTKEIVVVVRNSKQSVGLLVDRLEGQEQVVIKPLEKPVDKLRAVSSFGILQDGRIGIALDVEGLYV